MQFKVMIAHQRLNRMYDAILAYCELHLALDNGMPNILHEKTQALIAHDRILTDMEEPTGRTGESDWQRQLARIRMQNLRAFVMTPTRRHR